MNKRWKIVPDEPWYVTLENQLQGFIWLAIALILFDLVHINPAHYLGSTIRRTFDMGKVWVADYGEE